MILVGLDRTRIMVPQMRAERMRRTVLTTARLLKGVIPNHWRAVMVTLTYHRMDTHEPRQISAFTDILRKYLKRRGIRLHYVWTMEYQKRGAPHYHLVLWLPPRFKLPMPDKVGWWTLGTTKIEREKTNVVGYIAKTLKGSCSRYIAKAWTPDEYLVPRARICGRSRHDQVSPMVRWWLMPRWIRAWSESEGLPIGSWFERITGVGWLCCATGETRAPPMVLCGMGHNEIQFRAR